MYVRHAGYDRAGGDRSDARNCEQTRGVFFASACAAHLRFHLIDLSAESDELVGQDIQSVPNGARYRRCGIGQFLDEPSDMLGTCGRQDPELRHMPTKRIDQSDPLTR